MPLYEYECDACHHRFEVIQKFSDAPIDTCPKCGGAVTKQFSSPAIQFKGTGWYITDYARKGKGDGGSVPAGKSDQGSAASEGGSGTKADTASGSTSESKPETKSEAKSDTKSDAKGGAPATSR